MTTPTKNKNGTFVALAVVMVIAAVIGTTTKTKNDEPKNIKIMAIWEPEREVHMTYWIDNIPHEVTWRTADKSWSLTFPLKTGQVVKFQVENISTGGFVQCSIYQDGMLEDYMHRNDAGDCVVQHTVR